MERLMDQREWDKFDSRSPDFPWEVREKLLRPDFPFQHARTAYHQRTEQLRRAHMRQELGLPGRAAEIEKEDSREEETKPDNDDPAGFNIDFIDHYWQPVEWKTVAELERPTFYHGQVQPRPRAPPASVKVSGRGGQEFEVLQGVAAS